MSINITHFAVGGACTAGLLWVMPMQLERPRLVVLIGGLWAIVPDGHWWTPVGARQWRTFHDHSVWTNLFWGHGLLDSLDPADSVLLAGVTTFGFLLVLLVAEQRGYGHP